MAQSIPQTTKQWTVDSPTKGTFDGLKFHENESIPKLGDHDVLVHVQGVSLNYRDQLVATGTYLFPSIPSVVLGSDGAGTVVSTGTRVTRFKPGDKVITLFNQRHLGGPIDDESLSSGLGASKHGTLRQYGAFEEAGLVHMPSNLNFLEASTLTCAGTTAWNALFGPDQARIIPGQWVLTQGTGGVSLFAVQFAKAAGAFVIATTGSDAKAENLKKLGADHVINYKTNPEWGDEAKKLTPGGRGVDKVVEVAGPASIAQSFKAVRRAGAITIIGFVGGVKGGPSFIEVLGRNCTVNHVLVGDRRVMEDMCDAVEAFGDKLKPVVDKKTFKLEQAKEALEYMKSQAHIGNICIEVD